MQDDPWLACQMVDLLFCIFGYFARCLTGNQAEDYISAKSLTHEKSEIVFSCPSNHQSHISSRLYNILKAAPSIITAPKLSKQHDTDRPWFDGAGGGVSTGFDQFKGKFGWGG